MDAMPASSRPTFAHQTPLRIGAVALRVRDLAGMARFYRALLGLEEIAREPDGLSLGAGGVAFLRLMADPAALPDDRREAGLYHTAFLMPTRADLARWVTHIIRSRVPITGASDHGVSEAFYLDDPEGNGIEVYGDRPPGQWQWKDGLVRMTTVALDVGAILREIDAERESYDAAPAGLRIGHVHLRVGDVTAAEQFYTGALGLDITRSRDGATFMSSGGYHHHIGANVWHSAGAGMRDQRRAGLAYVALEAAGKPARDAVTERIAASGAPHDATGRTADPWGTELRLVLA